MKPAFEPEVTVSNSENGAVPDAGVVASAREASLRYVTDGMPGITRLKRKQQKAPEAPGPRRGAGSRTFRLSATFRPRGNREGTARLAADSLSTNCHAY